MGNTIPPMTQGRITVNIAGKRLYAGYMSVLAGHFKLRMIKLGLLKKCVVGEVNVH